jgi:hypothetical protein
MVIPPGSFTVDFEQRGDVLEEIPLFVGGGRPEVITVISLLLDVS